MANEPTIEMMDITIARFMGMEGSDEFIRQNYQYHKRWEMLMPVVEKIESLYDGSAFTVTIKGHWCLIDQNTQHWMAYRNTVDLKNIEIRRESKTESTYHAVYQFITWYNQQKQKDGEGKK